MVDSVQVFPPGYRVTDANDDPILGAELYFYDAGTTDAKTVYSDSGLSTALGVVVYTNAGGYPVASSGSSTPVSIYVDDTAYKCVIKDADGNTLQTLDNLKGALDTAPFETGDTATPLYPVISKSVDYTILTTDQGKVINVDATSATRTMTLPSAVTAGDGWAITIRHVGTSTSYRVTIATVSSQTIGLPIAGNTATSFQLVSYGETCVLVSDGANWHVISHVMGLMLGSGYHAEVYDNGTQTTGTLTPDPEEGNLQKVINGGAFTLAPPAEDCTIVLQITNNASAGTVTTSGFTKTTGDSYTTSDGDDFFFNIKRINGFSSLFIEALQ